MRSHMAPSCDSTGRPVLLWEEPLRVPLTKLVEDPSLVLKLLRNSPKPVVVHGIHEMLDSKEAFRLGFGWDMWKSLTATTDFSRVTTPPDWKAKCPFAEWRISPCGKQPVCETVKSILEGGPLKIAHDTEKGRGARDFLRSIPGFESFGELAYRNEDLNMYINGRGNITNLHYDREGNTNLHFCLAGSKRIIYMDHDQKHALRKRAVISSAEFKPQLRHDPSYLNSFAPIRCSDIELQAGEMLYMPKRSWHYMEYEAPNVSVTVPFYLSEAEKAKELSGFEAAAWQLLTNEARIFGPRRHTYFLYYAIIPFGLLGAPYLVGYPKLTGWCVRSGKPRLAHALSACNDAGCKYVLHPVNVICALTLGAPPHVPIVATIAVRALLTTAGAYLLRAGHTPPATVLAAAVAGYHLFVGALSHVIRRRWRGWFD